MPEYGRSTWSSKSCVPEHGHLALSLQSFLLFLSVSTGQCIFFWNVARSDTPSGKSEAQKGPMTSVLKGQWLRNVCLRLYDTRRVKKWPAKCFWFFDVSQMVADMVGWFWASLKMVVAVVKKWSSSFRCPQKKWSLCFAVKNLPGVCVVSLSLCVRVRLSVSLYLSVSSCRHTRTPEKDTLASRHGLDKEKHCGGPCQVAKSWQKTV